MHDSRDAGTMPGTLGKPGRDSERNRKDSVWPGVAPFTNEPERLNDGF
jgi:hypothetical protein